MANETLELENEIESIQNEIDQKIDSSVLISSNLKDSFFKMSSLEDKKALLLNKMKSFFNKINEVVSNREKANSDVQHVQSRVNKFKVNYDEANHEYLEYKKNAVDNHDVKLNQLWSEKCDYWGQLNLVNDMLNEVNEVHQKAEKKFEEIKEYYDDFEQYRSESEEDIKSRLNACDESEIEEMISEFEFRLKNLEEESPEQTIQLA